ncbi:glycosyltransferase family 2 protein [Mucilaginibacter sp. HD30]
MEKTDLKATLPLVSVIIPVYNAERYIDAAITSALSQSWPCIEVIVVDDGSTDSSYELAKRYQANNVKILQQSNKGASAARNKGLSIAGGAYIQFLDADDLLSADKIAEQMAALQNNAGKIAVCSTVHFQDGFELEASQPSAYDEGFLYNCDNPVDFLIRLLGGYDFRGSMVQPAAWLVPRDIIDEAGPWNESLTLDDDGEFFARVMLASAGIIKTDGKVYYRKFSAGNRNLSSTQSVAALQSLYRSIKLKAEYLYRFGETIPAKKATYKQLVELQITCYITQPGLYNTISKELSFYPQWRYVPVMGGKIINTIAGLFGWRVAKKLQRLYSKYKR